MSIDYSNGAMELPQKLIELTLRVGRRVPIWTQGAGGNISEKTSGGDLWIKASGKRLDSIRAHGAMARVNADKFRSQIENVKRLESEELKEQAYDKTLLACSSQSDGLGRPSMETAFHALLPAQFVLHFHSLFAVLMSQAALVEPAKWLAWSNKFQARKSVMLLDVLQPGLSLGLELSRFPSQPIFVLRNHGVILQGTDASILDDWETIEAQFASDWGYEPLLVIHQSADPIARSMDYVQTLPPMPMKIYFPDMAVFQNRIASVLSGSDKFHLRDTALQIDRDAAELWLATRLLFEFCPDLSEIPMEMSAALAKMPTEKFRLKLGIEKP